MQTNRPQNPIQSPGTALVRADSKPGALAQVLAMPMEYVQLVKDVAAKESTDEEFCLFLQIVHDTGLNPLTKEIWFYKLWDGVLQKKMPVIHASIQGRRKAAERYARQSGGAYVPGRETEYEYDKDGNLLSATAYVKRYLGGEWHEISFTAFWEEFARYDKNNKLSGKWATMGKHMLAKCAENHALNRAFPSLERLADTDSVSTASFGAAGLTGGGGEPPSPVDPELEHRRGIIRGNLDVMAEIMLTEDQRAKLSAWLETADLQAMSDKFHTALGQFTQYGRGVYDSIPEAERSEALLSFNVGALEELDFEALASFIRTYEKEAKPGDFPTHTGE
jgi:phage recombination protein Bet